MKYEIADTLSQVVAHDRHMCYEHDEDSIYDMHAWYLQCLSEEQHAAAAVFYVAQGDTWYHLREIYAAIETLTGLTPVQFDRLVEACKNMLTREDVINHEDKS